LEKKALLIKWRRRNYRATTKMYRNWRKISRRC